MVRKEMIPHIVIGKGLLLISRIYCIDMDTKRIISIGHVSGVVQHDAPRTHCQFM